MALAAGIGELELHRDAPTYALWHHFVHGGSRFDEWRARLAAAPDRPREGRAAHLRACGSTATTCGWSSAARRRGRRSGARQLLRLRRAAREISRRARATVTTLPDRRRRGVGEPRGPGRRRGAHGVRRPPPRRTADHPRGLGVRGVAGARRRRHARGDHRGRRRDVGGRRRTRSAATWRCWSRSWSAVGLVARRLTASAPTSAPSVLAATSAHPPSRSSHCHCASSMTRRAERGGQRRPTTTAHRVSTASERRQRHEEQHVEQHARSASGRRPVGGDRPVVAEQDVERDRQPVELPAPRAGDEHGERDDVGRRQRGDDTAIAHPAHGATLEWAP